MRQEIIKNILDEKKRKKKKNKKMKPIGKIYSFMPVFSDPTIGTPEGMEEGLNLRKKPLTTPKYYFKIFICKEWVEDDYKSDCNDGHFQLVEIPKTEIKWESDLDADDVYNRDEAIQVIYWCLDNKIIPDDWFDKVDYVEELSELEYIKNKGDKESELDEEGGGLSDTLGQNDLPQVPKWESGITRGHANPIDFKKPWESGITRGHANSLFEGLNLPKKPQLKTFDIYDVDTGNVIMKVTRAELDYLMDDNWVWYDGRNYVTFNDSFQLNQQIGVYKSSLFEGLNLVKKPKNPIFDYLDLAIVDIRKDNAPNLGKNIFRLYSDKTNKNMVFKIIVYPSGNVKILQYRFSFLGDIAIRFNVDRDNFDIIFDEWFKSRHGDKIINEGINLPKKISGKQTRFPDNLRDAIVSDGTMNDDHLIPKFLAYLNNYEWIPNYQKQVDEANEIWERIQYNEENDIAMDLIYEEKSELTNDLFELMIELSPVGTSFGSSFGDGACYGFWDYYNKECPECNTEMEDIDYENVTGFCPNCNATFEMGTMDY